MTETHDRPYDRWATVTGTIRPANTPTTPEQEADAAETDLQAKGGRLHNETANSRDHDQDQHGNT